MGTGKGKGIVRGGAAAVNTQESNLSLEEVEEELEPIQYRTRNGVVKDFNISERACRPFGFYYADRVETPKGPASVVGVADGTLWFHIDGDTGASFWDTAKSYEHLLNMGFALLSSTPVSMLDLKDDAYRVKQVVFNGRKTNVVLQNKNGPCPLVSTCNLLLLRGLIEVSDVYASVDNILKVITDYVTKIYPKPKVEDSVEHGEWSKNMELFNKYLPRFQDGLDVNIRFDGIDAFAQTEEWIIFKLLDIKVVHGWIVDPQSELAPIIGKNTYNDLMDRIVAAQSKDDKMQVDNKADNSSNNQASNSASNTTQDKSNEPQLSEEEILKQAKAADQFLGATQTQLTEYGLHQLTQNLQEGELCVFFRNNHFSTLIKNEGSLYLLVNDIGYEKEKNIVWGRLDSVDGNSPFFTGDFHSSEKAKIVVEEEPEPKYNQSIINQLLDMGYTLEQAMQALKNTKGNSIQDALEYLFQHAT